MRFANRLVVLSAFLLVSLLALAPRPALAIPEAERLWLVGVEAFSDRLYPISRQVLERFVLRYPQDPRFRDAVLLLGKSRLALGQLEGALESFRQAQRFPNPPGGEGETAFWEGEALFRLKRYAEARSTYERVSAGSPFAADAAYGLGWSALELKESALAMGAFKRIVERWPSHSATAGATYHLARLYTEAKRYADVQALLGDYSAKFPESQYLPETSYLLGFSELQLGRNETAAATLRDFVTRFPNHELTQRARLDLMDALLREGRTSEAEKEIQALLVAKPATPEGLQEVAVFAIRLGNEKDAESAWRRLRQEFPKHPLARTASLDLARQAFDRRQWKEAAAAAESSAQSDEPAVRLEGYLILGESELKLKQPKPALKAFQSAVDLEIKDSPLHYRALAGIGLVHEGEKEWALAATSYQEVARASPDPTLKAWADERLLEVKSRLKPQPKPKPQAKPQAKPQKTVKPGKSR
jgi:TolA-binding protein